MFRLSLSLLGLAFAWLCLLQPQGLVVDVVHWLRGAAHFSHQERLTMELRVALARAALPAAEATQVAVADAGSAARPVASLPTVTLEKFLLVGIEQSELLPPGAEAQRLIDDGRDAAVRTHDVPVPVPRWGPDSAVL